MFTDIENSTQLLEALGEDYPGVVARTRALLRRATSRHRGDEIDSPGDAFFAAFAVARDAVHAAVDIQRAFNSEPWPRHASVLVRMGLHTGQPRIVDGGYFGLDVHRAARIAAAARGGQVLLSGATRAELDDDDVPYQVAIRNLGWYRLKDIRYPEVLFDLSIPGLSDSFGSLRSFDARPNNLPIASTAFVGRQRQLERVCGLLLQDDTRLLTLSGPGGTGKTRLAIEAAHKLLNHFDHGVFYVPLAAVSDSSLLASTIAQALRLPEIASMSPLDRLKHHLARRETLLLLDNFEHLLPGRRQRRARFPVRERSGTAMVDATAVVLDLLSECPKLKILVTSREAFNVRPEREYVVSPLVLPHRGVQSDLPSLEAVESVRLFVDRARADDANFSLTADNAEAVCGICSRLDGLPLALELAATRLKIRHPAALLKELRNSLDLLGGGPRDLADHQRTLKGTIAWSYGLLELGERLLFRRMSVFRGGCTTDSAVAIGSGGPSSGDVQGRLMSLVRKSLVTHSESEGEIRLGMLETIREFAAQQLEATAESGRVAQRHAEHYLAMAERMAPRIVGRDQREYVTAVMAEEDNLRAALTWAIEHHDVEMTSRLITALLWLWIPRGQFAEGRTWTNRALDAFSHAPPNRAVALIFEAVGWLGVLGGDYARSLPRFESALKIFQALSSVRDLARAKTTLAVTCLVLDDPRGSELSDEAVVHYQSLDDKHGRALALVSAGIKHQLLQQADGATACYEAALQAFYEVDNVFWAGIVLLNLAEVRLQEGDWKRAAALAAEGLDIGREYNYPMIVNLSLAKMGGVAVAKGQPIRAAQFLGAVDASLSSLGVSVTLEPPDHLAMQANIDATKALIDAAVYAAAFEEGRRWRESDVIAAVASLRYESVESAC